MADLQVGDATGKPTRDRIVVSRFSTDHLPSKERYTAWHLRDWPRSEPIYRTEPNEAFNCRWAWAHLGSVMFVHTEITGMRWERRLDDIRRSDFDPLIVSMMKSGFAQGDFDGRAFREPAGTFHFHDLGRPSIHMSTASETYSLVIPRPLAREWFGPIDDLHGLVAEGPIAGIVFAQAEQVLSLLPVVDTEAGERLGRVFLELLSVVLSSIRPPTETPVPAEAALRKRAIALIDGEIGFRQWSVDDLCRALGVSRARLFAAFKADGGVQAFAMTQRLERVRSALAEPGRDEPIGTIADRLGFSDPGHLSRAFRQRFGMTPREYRQLRQADVDLLATGQVTPTDIQI